MKLRAPQWYVNTQGQTFVVIPGPVMFSMGSPPTEAARNVEETQHKERIGRTFAIAAKLVTVAEYRIFDPGYGIGEIEEYARTADSPVVGTSWFQAARYCNWLSKQEGLPESEWCYEPFHDPKAWPQLAVSSVGLLHSPGGQGLLLALSGMYPGRTDAKYERGMRLSRNYLQRQGYRLPTEAEVEYATRAGTLTARYFGETEALLVKYACYSKNSQDKTWPVARLKPNDLGLFDVHGNVFVWCQERYRRYPQSCDIGDDKEDSMDVISTDSRVMRGSSFFVRAPGVRSAYRNGNVPTQRNSNNGFRAARTLPLGSVTALPVTSERDP
jgi:formylglycine-generating enzyme required for sulfatase activity